MEDVSLVSYYHVGKPLQNWQLNLTMIPKKLAMKFEDLNSHSNQDCHPDSRKKKRMAEKDIVKMELTGRLPATLIKEERDS